MKKLCLSLIVGILFFGCQSTPEESATPAAPAPAAKDASFGAAAPVQDAAASYSRGNELAGRYAFDQAIGEYTDAIKKDPKMTDAYIARGNAYSGKLQRQDAMKDYSAGAQINADYDNYAKGYSMYVAGNYKGAVAEFTKAIDKKNNLLAAYNDRGLCYANMGELDKAIADYDAALKINSNALVYNNRGNAYYAKADYDKAIENYSKASELYPVLVYAHSGRGMANYQKKSYDNAIADYTKAIALTPQDPVLYSLRGDAFSARKDKALADADYAKAKDLKK